MVRKLHSATAVVDVLDIELDEDDGPAVGDEPLSVEVDVESGADVVEVGEVVGVVGSVVTVVSTSDDVGANGATATGSPTWESARPTICHVRTVVSTRATTHAAAIRQLIMW
jgi:hypothetical protein